MTPCALTLWNVSRIVPFCSGLKWWMVVPLSIGLLYWVRGFAKFLSFPQKMKIKEECGFERIFLCFFSVSFFQWTFFFLNRNRFRKDLVLVNILWFLPAFFLLLNTVLSKVSLYYFFLQVKVHTSHVSNSVHTGSQYIRILFLFTTQRTHFQEKNKRWSHPRASTA